MSFAGAVRNLSRLAAFHVIAAFFIAAEYFQRGADRAAIVLSVITTCRLNDVDPKAWLADVFARIADLPVFRLHELLPWQWKAHKATAIAAAA